MKGFVRCACIGLLMLGCQGKNEGGTGTIVIDVKAAVEEPLFSAYEFLKLETTDKSLLPDIDKILMLNDTIILYNLQKNLVILFDINGKFVHRFSIGQGPDELINPFDIAVDNERGTLWILDIFGHSKEFSLQGKLINQIITEEPYMRIYRFAHSLLLFDANAKRANPYWFEIVKDGKSEHYIPKKEKFKKIPYLPVTAFCPVNDSVIYFHHQFDDYIFSWNALSNQMDTAYRINYVNAKSIASWNEGAEIQNVDEYRRLLVNKEYVFGIDNLYSFHHTTLFFTVEDKSIKYCLYDMKRHEIKLSKHLVAGLPNAKKNLYKGQHETLLYTLTPEEIQDFLNDPSVDVKSPKLEALSKELALDDNPVIVFIKPRNEQN